MSHALSSPTPSQGSSINNAIFDARHSQNMDGDTNSIDHDWMDKYFEENPYGPSGVPGVHSQGASFPSVPPSGTSLIPSQAHLHKRKRLNDTASSQSTSKPKARRISRASLNAGTTPLYIPDLAFEPTKPATTSNTPLTHGHANVLFPDPDQFSGIVSGRHSVPDELNDTIFSPMPPTFDQQLEQIWDTHANNELSSPVSENVPSAVTQGAPAQSTQGAAPAHDEVPAPLPVAEQRTEQVVPAPSIAHVKHTTLRPSDEIGAESEASNAPRVSVPTPASKVQLETDSSPRKTQYIITDVNPEDVFDRANTKSASKPKKNAKKSKKRKRAIRPSRTEDDLPQQDSWLVEENEDEDEDSFIVDDTADASGPPKKKRRKNRKLAAREGFNTGAWTNAEHQRFLEGLNKYGRSKWREIADFVGTRSRIQVASHSQKYFAKLDAHTDDVEQSAPAPRRAKSRGKKQGKKQ